MTAPARSADGRHPVYFISDSTGITAETLGNALLAHFPSIDFDRRILPFVDTVEAAHEVIREIGSRSRSPLVFMTVKSPGVAEVIAGAPGQVVDLLSGHLTELERILGTSSSEALARYHGVGDLERYHARMRAVEYAIEHDDAQSVRMLDQADVIIIAPSRCGKTPTAMYLALQHGLRVANYPLTDDDYPSDDLPAPIAPFAVRCFGLTTTAQRLSQVRQERRPGSVYASLEQCRRELRWAEGLYRRHRIPNLNSQAKSVEEMSTVILQTMKLRE